MHKNILKIIDDFSIKSTEIMYKKQTSVLYIILLQIFHDVLSQIKLVF